MRGWLQEHEGGPADRLYYLATPPRFFTDIVARLGQSDMVSQEDGFRRVVVEKPFGTDLESARSLNRSLHEILEENQIYRIDHTTWVKKPFKTSWSSASATRFMNQSGTATTSITCKLR